MTESDQNVVEKYAQIYIFLNRKKIAQTSNIQHRVNNCIIRAYLLRVHPMVQKQCMKTRLLYHYNILFG